MTDWPFASPIKPMKARVHVILRPKAQGGGTTGCTASGCGWWHRARAGQVNGKPLPRTSGLTPRSRAVPTGTAVTARLSWSSTTSRSRPTPEPDPSRRLSGIELLSDEIPAELVAFDLLAVGGEDLRDARGPIVGRDSNTSSQASSFRGTSLR